MKFSISLIAAMDSKNGIGKDNKLLFRIPEDFQRLKALSLNHPVVMGRKTFESIGKILPNRVNVIVSKSISDVPGAIVARSIDEALDVAKRNDPWQIFIFGGGEIFRQTIDRADKLYLTLVEGDYMADTFFPDYSGFNIISETKGQSSGYKYTFVDLQRK